MSTVPYRGTRILAILALTNLASYASRNALFAVYPTLRVKYGMDNADLGLMTTMFMLPHAAATTVFGWAGDRFDRRRVIAAGMVVASLAGVLGALAPTMETLAVTRGLVGLGTAAVVPVANSILGQVFDGPRKASRLSIFNLGLFLGGVAGFAFGTLLGFPLVVIAIGIPGLALAVAILGLDDVVRVGGRREGRFRAFASELFADWRILLRITTLRWIIVSTISMAFAAGAYNAWLKDFLTLPIAKHGKGMTEGHANMLLMTALVGGLSGILLGARISDRLSRTRATGRLWTIVIGMSCTVPAATAAILLPDSPWLYVAGILTLFFISWYHAPMAAAVDDLAPVGMAVAAQGLVISAMHILGTAPSSWVVGRVSVATNLQTALWVPTVALAVAALAMALATRTFAADRDRAKPNRANQVL
ncbi:MAG: MFS transporter [Proteobacteria bacterium]|nr:MFS transporter [Pseudomonadota bacterium]